MSKRIILVLTDEQAGDLTNSFESATRGRDDFEYLVRQENGDYEPDDVEARRRLHEGEKGTERFVLDQIAAQLSQERDTTVNLGDLERTIELSQALASVGEAAAGDSSDAEIDAYREAVDLALSRWPDVRAEY